MISMLTTISDRFGIDCVETLREKIRTKKHSEWVAITNYYTNKSSEPFEIRLSKQYC